MDKSLDDIVKERTSGGRRGGTRGDSRDGPRGVSRGGSRGSSRGRNDRQVDRPRSNNGPSKFGGGRGGKERRRGEFSGGRLTPFSRVRRFLPSSTFNSS